MAADEVINLFIRIIGSVGSLVYSFNFSSNNHFIFISCIIVGLLIYLGFNYIQGKKKFVIGSIIADGILLLIPSTMDCLTYNFNYYL